MADYCESGSDDLFSSGEDISSQEEAADISDSVRLVKSAAASTQEDTLSEIKLLLQQVVQKVDKNEAAIQQLQEQLTRTPIQSPSPNATEQSSASIQSTPSTPKRSIGKPVRQETRRVYKLLMDENTEFAGWDISTGSTFKSPKNRRVLDLLIKEVKGLNPSFDATDIRGAAYRFYRSHCEEESLRRRGRSDEKKIAKRRHERIVRKRKEREAAVMKNSKLTQEQKEKWASVMKNELMSSEESGVDGEGEDITVVHPLPWRSKYCSKMFSKIDSYIYNSKSSQSRRQMKHREHGTPSTRAPPPGINTLPTWAFEETKD